MWVLKAGILYFALTFGAAFVLGTIRTLWAVPKYGTRIAELLESPIMLVVVVLAARWIVRRLGVPPTLYERLGVGLTALGLLLVAEFSLVRWVRGLTIEEYWSGRDPVAAMVYVLLLAVLAVMPLLVYRK
jgi:hypothetical protein